MLFEEPRPYKKIERIAVKETETAHADQMILISVFEDGNCLFNAFALVVYDLILQDKVSSQTWLTVLLKAQEKISDLETRIEQYQKKYATRELFILDLKAFIQRLRSAITLENAETHLKYIKEYTKTRTQLALFSLMMAPALRGLAGDSYDQVDADADALTQVCDLFDVNIPCLTRKTATDQVLVLKTSEDWDPTVCLTDEMDDSEPSDYYFLLTQDGASHHWDLMMAENKLKKRDAFEMLPNEIQERQRAREAVLLRNALQESLASASTSMLSTSPNSTWSTLASPPPTPGPSPQKQNLLPTNRELFPRDERHDDDNFSFAELEVPDVLPQSTENSPLKRVSSFSRTQTLRFVGTPKKSPPPSANALAPDEDLVVSPTKIGMESKE